MKYKAVEKLARDKELKTSARKRKRAKPFKKAHGSDVQVLVPFSGAGSKIFYTGDIKGNLLYWSVGNYRSINV